MLKREVRFGVVCWLVVGVIVLALGCDSGQSIKGRNRPVEMPSEPLIDTATATPLFDGWPKPTLAIVLTGQQLGFLEPCGCSETQSGGLSRRADLFRQMNDRGWTVTAFDLGGTIKRNREQSRWKFQTTLAALNDLQYQALTLGPQELQFGPYFLLSQQKIPDADSTLTLLGANTVLLGDANLGTPKHSKLVQLGSVKIGVTAVIGLSYKNRILQNGIDQDIAIENPLSVLPQVVQQLQAQKPDLMILLSHASLDESKQLARKIPEFDLILSAGGPEDPLTDNPKYVDRTMLATVGHKGKYVGVVGFYPGDVKDRLRFELVDLDHNRFHDSTMMISHMRFYQEQLQDLDLAAEELPIKHPKGAKFVGAEKCGECHTKAYDKWKSTPHAHAYESLDPVNERHGYERLKGIARIYDAECLSCHVTGWHPQDVLRYESGFIKKQKTPHLLGNQCENCHGPGSRHVDLVEADDVDKAINEMRVTLEQAKQDLCYECHDLDNSPHFEFDSYWEQVKHPWID